MSNTNKTKPVTNQMVCGQIAKLEDEYSTYFNKNFNVDGSPDDIELEDIFNAPQDHVDDIIGYSKYCYRKHGIIMRVVNMYRDFGCTKMHLHYKEDGADAEKAKEVIDTYNKRVNMLHTMGECIFEIAQTGNLVLYDRNGKRLDIYPIDRCEPVPLLVSNKPLIKFKIEQDFDMSDYDEKIKKKINSAYPKEVLKAQKAGKDFAVLDIDNTYFAKINCSQYETYGLSVIVPAFEDLSHKNLLKNAERSTANAVINKILLMQVGDENNPPNANLIAQYQKMLEGMSGSIGVSVPYYVNMSFIEPSTEVFGSEKFVEIDKDILNTLGVSVSLLRGEGGGSYSDGLMNFTSLCRNIEAAREPLPDIVHALYQAELKRNRIDPKYAPTVEFGDVIIDKEAKMQLLISLFQDASLPYELLYEGCGMDFDHVKLLKKQEKARKLDELFEPHAMPFQGNQGEGSTDEGGAPKKTDSERKSDKSKSNNKQARPDKKSKSGVKTGK